MYNLLFADAVLCEICRLLQCSVTGSWLGIRQSVCFLRNDKWLMWNLKCCLVSVDMWSVGCIMAEMMTGKSLFPGTDRILSCYYLICRLSNQRKLSNFRKLIISAHDSLLGEFSVCKEHSQVCVSILKKCLCLIIILIRLNSFQPSMWIHPKQVESCAQIWSLHFLFLSHSHGQGWKENVPFICFFKVRI